MTIDEAIKIGCREQGYTDAEIEEAEKHANRESPNMIAWGAETIPTGREREFIDNWKSASSLSKEDREQLKSMCREVLERHHNKN